VWPAPYLLFMQENKIDIMKLKLILFSVVIAVTFFACVNLSSVEESPQPTVNAAQVDSLQLLADRLARLSEMTNAKGQGNKQALAGKKLINAAMQELSGYAMNLHGGREVWYRHVKYRIFIANLDSDDVRIHLYKKGLFRKNLSDFESLKHELEEEKLKPFMMTNAGMFNKDLEPHGLYIEEDHTVFFPLDTLKNIPDANFYMKPNGVFYLDANGKPHIDTTETLQRKNEAELKRFRLATQSGPMLIINGRIHPKFVKDSPNKKIRSGVALNKKYPGKVIFAVALDECNFYDFSKFFSEMFNSDNALFLDGAISQMYLNGFDNADLDGIFGPMISVTSKK
jgi:uncharacterized protein YigE (DUF2233 family)